MFQGLSFGMVRMVCLPSFLSASRAVLQQQRGQRPPGMWSANTMARQTAAWRC